jgi:hypothetical protein
MGGASFNEIDSALVRNKPGYTIHTTSSFPPNSIGLSFAFKVEAYNVIGSTFSTAGASFTLADLPQNPLKAPISDETVTSTTRIKVEISPITPQQNGGSPILSYSLEIDDGFGGQFVAVYGLLVNSLSTSYTLTSGVQKGALFRARYRVKNIIGWSDYSPIGYILAAVVPSTPPQPAIVSAQAESILIQIFPSADEGGTDIDYY